MNGDFFQYLYIASIWVGGWFTFIMVLAITFNQIEKVKDRSHKRAATIKREFEKKQNRKKFEQMHRNRVKLSSSKRSIMVRSR